MDEVEGVNHVTAMVMIVFIRIVQLLTVCCQYFCDLLKEGTEVQFFGHQDVPVSISNHRAGRGYVKPDPV